MITERFKSYKNLDIYKQAFEIAFKIHQKSLELPKFELYETGSQIRRSSQGIKDAIVEGYGRRRYKNDFIKFLVYAHASLLESISQAEFLNKVYKDMNWNITINDLEKLGSKIHNFITYVENHWKTHELKPQPPQPPQPP